MTDSPAIAEAIRKGCAAAGKFLRCSYPDCSCTQMPAAIRATLAYIEQTGKDGWRTIDSAPRNGTTVDLWRAWKRDYGYRIPNCFWRNDVWCVYIGEAATPIGTQEDFTHWRPLPAPPASAKEEGER